MKKNKSVLEHKIKNRYLIYIILFSYLFGSFLGIYSHNVTALENIENEYFDNDLTTGNAYEDEWFNSTYTLNSFTPFSYGSSLSSPNVFKLYCNQAGLINGIGKFFFNSSDEISSLSFYLNYENPSTGTLPVGTSYINLCNNTGTTMLGLYFAQNTNSIDFNYFDGTYHSFAILKELFWYKAVFTFTSSNVCNLSFYNNTGNTYMGGHTFGLGAVKETFRYINFYLRYPSANINYIYIDNLQMIEGTQEESLCGFDTSIYLSKGTLIYDDLIMDKSKKVIETDYKGSFDTTIYGIGLLVGNGQYDYDSNLANYYLYVNGFNFGQPSCFSQYSGNTYLLFWEETINLEKTDWPNDRFIFSFLHLVPLFVNTYWQVACSTNIDLDLDGDAEFKYGDLAIAGNKIYDGSYENFNDLSYIFYYSGFSFENETSNYDDLITTSKNTFEEYEDIPLLFTVSDLTSSYEIHAYHNGTETNNANFPYSIPPGETHGSLTYFATDKGYENIELEKDGVVVSSINLTITATTDKDFILKIYPNPYTYNSGFYVYYRYYPSDGKTGLISIYVEPSFSSIGELNHYWLIDPNTTEELFYQGATDYYVSLYKQTGNTTFFLKKMLRAFIYVDSENYITVQYKTYDLAQNEILTQKYIGRHSFIGLNGYIYQNNLNIINVGTGGYFTKYYNISEAKIYYVSLKINTLNGTIEVANTTFTITGEGYTPGEEPLISIPAPYSYFAGIFVILLFLLTPLLIGRLTNNMLHLPQIFYFIMAIVGFVVSCILGFFPIWSIFVLILLGIFIIVIIWLKDKQ